VSEEPLFTIKEIADKYRVSEETIRRWIKTGDIDFVPVGPFRLKRLHIDAVIKGKSDVGKRAIDSSLKPGENKGTTRNSDGS